MFRLSKKKKQGSIIASEGGESNPYHYYARPYTPGADYPSSIQTPSVDYKSQTPSETPTTKDDGLATPETLSTTNDDDTRDSSPSRDSGVADVHQAPLGKQELGHRSAELCRELKIVTNLSLDFLQDVLDEKERSRDLLDELETKIRPFLIGLDEDMSVLEVLLRRNLDRCRITETRVTWLLQYNRFLLEFRKALNTLTEVFDELGPLIRLRARGCVGLTTKRDLSRLLRALLSSLTRVDTDIRQERATPDQ